MRRIKEVLRLHFESGLGQRQIGRALGISHATVREYLRRAAHAGLSWPLPAALSETQLEQRLFPPPIMMSADERPLPDWSVQYKELKRKGVTLFLLWQEYKAVYPEGYQYSRFCELYRAWAGKVDVAMRQTHKAGEKMFVDYAGQTLSITDPQTGEIKQAQIFVATLGASSYTYAEATWTQTLPDWIGSHTRAFAFFGGVTGIIVPDNLKSGVARPCPYEPDINRTYMDLAAHYGTAIIPARARKPKDKAKVESGVQVVGRWILARLRNRTFFSLAEANTAIAELLTQLNDRPFQKLPGSRREMFETLDKPALKQLPASPYTYAQWKKARVNIDYHVEVDGHYYSVPYQLIKQSLEVRFTAHTVECFLKGKRVAGHRRSARKGGHTTVPEHMPKAHQQYAEWTPRRLIKWAASFGPNTSGLVEAIMRKRAHPQQGFRSALGLMRLGKQYGPQRLENACERALATGATSYRSVSSILSANLDKQPPQETGETVEPIEHGNIRGADYYH
jgi:transposase